MTKPELRLTPDQATILSALPRRERRSMLALLQSRNPIRKAALRASIVRAEQRGRSSGLPMPHAPRWLRAKGARRGS